MPAALSNDLRWRIIFLVLGGRKSIQETATLFGVTKKTIRNILRRFRLYGHINPSRIGRPNMMSAITRVEAFCLMEYVLRHPGAYLREAVQYLENETGGQFNALAIWRCLKRHNFTRKKVDEFLLFFGDLDFIYDFR